MTRVSNVQNFTNLKSIYNHLEKRARFGWPHYLLLDRRIPLFYSSKYVEFDKFIIVDKSFGIWIFKRGNVDDTLTIEVRSIDNDPENVDILVVTKVFYKKENHSAIRIIAPIAQ